jgi:Ca2+-transporting ATPase
MSGTELNDTSDEQLVAVVDDIDVFARVSPAHKVRIVEAFRTRNYVVAMTGDGVNDAPALKRASIGVAMGITGTDVSKETADMVLTDDNYRSIVAAVEQGRIIYSNIRKFVYYLLSANVAEIVTIFAATLMGEGSPLSPIQLLWLNLVTDGAPALALGVEKGDPDVMDRPPRPPDEPIIDYNMRVNMVVQSIVLSAVTLAAFFLGLRGAEVLGLQRSGPEVGQTMAFVTISIAELFIAYTARSELHSILGIGPFKNRVMQYAVLVSLTLLLLTIYVPFLHDIFDTIPLGLAEWRIILPLTLLPPLATELAKFGLRGRDRRKRAALASAA